MTPPPASANGAFAPLMAALELGQDLRPAEIAAAVTALTDSNEPSAAKATFLRALRKKGESVAEIAGFADALLSRAVDPAIDPERLPGPMLDVCGTGGDRLHLFNVSTTASFVLAAGGAAVVKHGNRAITSRSGGSDVLAALGVPTDLDGAGLRRQLESTGLAFLSAPRYHPAFAAVAEVRRQLAAEGTITIFNLLGPLLNPARPAHQLVGVYAAELTSTFAEVLGRLGRRRAWAVHGSGGMDELSTLGPTQVSRFHRDADPAVDTMTIDPSTAGLACAPCVTHLQGGTPEENARTLTGILDGTVAGPRLDLVLINAAAGFVVAGLAPDLGTGVERARKAITDGVATRILRQLQGVD